MRSLLMLMLMLFAVICMSCSGDKMDPLSAPLEDFDLPDEVTYTDHIKALLDRACIRCHSTELTGEDRQGAPSDVNLNTYKEAIQVADRANQRIQGGTMPFDVPEGLPLHERALFTKWVVEGLQQ